MGEELDKSLVPCGLCDAVGLVLRRGHVAAADVPDAPMRSMAVHFSARSIIAVATRLEKSDYSML